jgi:di/tricarboxylate transporter
VPGGLTGPQLAFFAILVAAFALLITERLRNDLVGLLIVLALAITGILAPPQALSGFSSEPAIVMAAILVLGAGVEQTGLSEMIGRWIGRLAGGGTTRALAVLMSLVGLLSAFTHHVTTTAMMLPVTLDLAKRREVPPSRLLMPLSFAASLGTTITIIGVPAFLIASGLLQQAGRPGLSVFSIAPIGLALTAVGTLFTILLGRLLLPDRQPRAEAGALFRLDEYFTEVTILPDSPFLGRTIEDVEADERYSMRVSGWVREGVRRRRPLPSDEKLREGDVLLVRARPEALVAIREERGIELHPVQQYGDPSASEQRDEDMAERLVQAVVAPASALIGRTIRAVDFRRHYGAIVVGLWRREGWLDRELADIRLHAGDVLVLQGDSGAISRVAADSGFLLMVPFPRGRRARSKAPLAGAIMVGTVALAAFEVLSLEVASLAGAVAMVVAGCLTLPQAYRAVDTRVFVFIAGAIPLGLAMEKSGASAVLARALGAVMSGWSEIVILLTLFWVTALLTQFMSDAATTALVAPVALAMAQGLGQSPEASVVTVAMAAVASFLTPIGHHGNLLVYAPGGYRFWDFVRLGAPLTAVVSVIVVFLARMLWPA